MSRAGGARPVSDRPPRRPYSTAPTPERHTPRKRLGQHFLTDRHALTRIVDALDIAAGDTVVEIGPGRGALTELLLSRAARVVAIELDRKLVPMLRDKFAGDARLTVLEADVLTVPLGAAAGGPSYLVAGNLPYYITTPILFHALEWPRPARAVYLVQREVAERAVAMPGTKVYGALSVNIQAIGRPRIIGVVGPRSFVPAPSVESAILRIDSTPTPAVTDTEQPAFAAFVVAAFGLRRKQMRRVIRTLANLDAKAADATLAEAHITPDVRPETLAPTQFAALWRLLRDRNR